MKGTIHHVEKASILVMPGVAATALLGKPCRPMTMRWRALFFRCELREEIPGSGCYPFAGCFSPYQPNLVQQLDVTRE